MNVYKIKEKLEAGDMEGAKNMIEQYSDHINQTNSWGQTNLMAACKLGSIDLINLLIDAGASLDMRDKYGSTTLHLAVNGRQLQAVMVLMSRGSNVNVKDKDGWTPLHVAAAKGEEWKEVLVALLQTKGPCVIEVNQQDNIGRTPLHCACLWGHTDSVRLLLNHNGIDANMVTNKDNTALHLAIIKGHYDVVALMLSQDSVKLEMKNCDIRTPLLEAVTCGHLGMVHKLMGRGAKLNAVDNEGNNCLHLGIKRDKFHSEKEHIPFIDKCCNELELGKEKRLSGVVVACYLASQGADFYQKNCKDITPLDLIGNGALKDKLEMFLLSRCMLCEVNEAMVVFLPCRHTLICEECGKMELKQCLKCNTDIKCKHGFVISESVKVENKEVQTDSQLLEQVGSLKLDGKLLHSIAKNLGSKWQMAGVFLGIPEVERDIIKNDFPRDTIKQSYQMLCEWFISCDAEERSLETLKDAFKEAECYAALEYLSDVL